MGHLILINYFRSFAINHIHRFLNMFRKAQQSVAHQSTLPSGFNPLGNRDLKNLQEIINSEKDFIKSNARSAQDFHKTAEAIKNWSTSEGEDLNDVLGKLSLLFDSYATSQTRLNAHLSTIRQHFKSVRTREEALADMRARKRSLGSKIESVEKKLAKMGPENKELMKTTAQLKELRGEMESLRVEVQAEEAAIGDYKRRTVKEAMGIKCGGLLELAEKLTIIAEVGKMIIEEIPMEQTHPGMPRTDYVGAMRTDQLLQEATRGLADVGFTPSGSSAGVQRHDYGHQMRPSEIDDSNGDFYNSVTGNGVDESGEISRAGWQEQEQEHEQNPGQESYENRYSEDRQTTPIYAQHSSSLNHPPNDPTLSQDSATDQWRQTNTEYQSFSAPQPISTASRASGTPIADQFASRSPDNVQVGASNLRIVGGNDSNESLDQAGSANAIPPSVSSAAMYTSQNGGHHNSYGPNISTPPASQQFATPAEDPTNDDNYFQSVGSTRAAQQSVRRPMSPGGGVGGMGTPSIGSHIPSSPYEPPTEGRKMTAAAFRKGFGRGPSSQYAGGSTTSLGLAQPIGDTSENTAPLAIRKRFSAVPGQSGEGYQGEDHPPAPPYDAHQSVYGGLDPSDLEYAVPLQPPHQPWSGSRPNSRPGSAAGYRVPPPQQ